MSKDSYVEVPVVLNFDHEKIVGSVRILKSVLPPTPRWCLSLGYRKTDEAPDEYQLMCVSIVPDADYADFLRG